MIGLTHTLQTIHEFLWLQGHFPYTNQGTRKKSNQHKIWGLNGIKAFRAFVEHVSFNFMSLFLGKEEKNLQNSVVQFKIFVIYPLNEFINAI